MKKYLPKLFGAAPMAMYGIAFLLCLPILWQHTWLKNQPNNPISANSVPKPEMVNEKAFEGIACMNEVKVALGSDCTFRVTANILAEFNPLECNPAGITFYIADKSGKVVVNNRLTGEHAGQRLKYFLSHPICNPEGCWGIIEVEDKNTPRIDLVEFDNNPLLCSKVDYILNNPKTIGYKNRTNSPNQIPAGTIINYSESPDNIPNLGIVRFANCDPACPLTVKWSDKLEVYGCDSLAKNGLYARIFRTWVATNCMGKRLDTIQKIDFCRPGVADFQFNGSGGEDYDRIVTYSSCTPNKDSIRHIDVTPFAVKTRGTVIDTIFLDERPCNYSMQIKDQDFAICDGRGVKIDRQIYIFDWCKGGIVDTFHVLIKIGDFDAPKLIPPHHYNETLPIELSTGPLNCEASIPVTVKGLNEVLGVDITDNCRVASISLKVKSKDLYSKGFLVGSKGPDEPWYENAYPISNGVLSGLNPGLHWVVVEAFDGCYNAKKDSVLIKVVDKISPVMVIDDALQVSLANASFYSKGYAKICVADIDEGSFDNCNLLWMRVRRNVNPACASSFIEKGYDTNDNGVLDTVPADGDWTKADGFDNNGDGDSADYDGDGIDDDNDGKIDEDFGELFIVKKGVLMTPLMNCADFFCCDLNEKVTIELWGEDTQRNRNFAWTEISLEDKIAPRCAAPYNTTINCTDKCLANLDDKVESAKCFGDVVVQEGNDCRTLDTTYRVVRNLKCGAGTIERIWTLTKQTSKGPLSTTCTQIIKVLPVHEYNICFPKDLDQRNCLKPSADTLIKNELGCDLLSVNVKDNRYDASDGECYKIFRTYTVLNWCTFEDTCGDPLEAKNLLVIDRRTFQNHGKNPLYILVRDSEYKTRIVEATSANSSPYVDQVSYPPNMYDNAPPLQEYNKVAPETPFKNDGNEEFWISADLTPGNASNFANGDGDSDSNNNTKHDILVNKVMPYCQNSEEKYVHGFTYTQIIKVYDDIRPEVTVPVLDKIPTRPNDCLADAIINFNAKDNCTDQLELERAQLMVAPFQTLDAGKMILYAVTPRWNIRESRGNSYQVTIRDLPVGKHDLLVVVRDECGNLSLPTRIPFEIYDNKGPAPICINGLGTELMPDGNGGGMISVWANDFIASKIFDCHGQGPETQNGLKLVTKYSINRVGETPRPDQTGITLTCADAGLTLDLEIHAWDEKGNHDFCLTYLLVQDNRKLCPEGAIYDGEISGLVLTDDAEPLAGVNVQISGKVNKTQISGISGKFAFSSLQKDADYSITPILDKDHQNGVSTFDLVLIQKHVLGDQLLTNPYRIIAADVNNSHTITTIDLIQVRKLILGLEDRFKTVPSWKFVDASHKFSTPGNPWQAEMPEVVKVKDLKGKVNVDFMAIKMGDVNGNAKPNASFTGQSELRSGRVFNIQAEKLGHPAPGFKAGESVLLALKAKDLATIQGYQFTLNFDPQLLELENLEYHAIKAEHLGVFAKEGNITVSWNEKGFAPGAEQTLLVLQFKTKAAGVLHEALKLNSRRTAAEAYTLDDEAIGIQLDWGNVKATPTVALLYQNAPNPFQDETLIEFSLPEATNATLSIRDVAGRLLWTTSSWFAKGDNRVPIKANALKGGGVLYYTLEADGFTATRKMVLLD
ncbi:MAG TPA: hypothetical protein PLC89_02675 [Haliscomenobacter sp.]|uniref:hypothetical protein n=1 Tax=Haliscomenobacter sp. TaxID=2717303 RepID=UPI002C105C0F|nr:hypothetical protein [Haliscomenobacter sp.]HOY16162.1 hypothetical protein [Haliscomenobacter sp.]